MSAASAIPQPDPIRVAVVEDNHHYREAVLSYLADDARFAPVAAYDHGQAALEHWDYTTAVALVDLNLPDMSGIDIIRGLVERGFEGDMITLTTYDDDHHLFTALRSGACGYVLKGETDLDGLGSAIMEAVNGGAPMSPALARRVLASLREPPPDAPGPLDQLSERERQILTLLSQGLPPKKLTSELGISYQTVRTHQKNIYKKLQVRSLAEALAVAHGRGP